MEGRENSTSYGNKNVSKDVIFLRTVMQPLLKISNK
jgi:hypothetical protein